MLSPKEHGDEVIKLNPCFDVDFFLSFPLLPCLQLHPFPSSLFSFLFLTPHFFLVVENQLHLICDNEVNAHYMMSRYAY